MEMGGRRKLTNPDEIRPIDCDRVSTPDVLRVQLRNMDVLDDDVLRAVRDAETLSTDNTLVADTDDGLVRANGHTRHTGLVVGNLDVLGARTRVAVGAPAGVVDGILAAVSGALVGGGTASGFGGDALGALEVELLVEDDAAGGGVREPGLELGGGGGDDAGGGATTCGAGCEA